MKWKHSLSFLLLFLLASCIIAQGGSYANPIGNEEKRFIIDQLNDKFWGSDKSVYKTEIPKEFNSSPAVILYQTVSKEFYRNSRNYLRTTNLEHKVVFIQNREGIDENSIFSYEHIDSDFAFDVTAVKIVKPDGRERIINLDSITITKSYDKVEYRKFVIPGLEVGDILDYYYYLEFRVLFPQQYSRIFDPVYWLPQGEYPVLNYHLEFILGPSAFMNASINKLPDVKSVNYKIDRKTFSKYSIDLANLDPIDLDLQWFYPFRELPNIKFQVFIGPYSGNTEIVYNLGGSLKLNTAIRQSRLQDYMVFSLQPGRDYKRHYTEFLLYLKSFGARKKKVEKLELALLYYEYVRTKKELVRLMEGQVQTDAYHFISRAHYCLSKLNVNHDIVLAFDRSLTDIGQFVLSDEISPMLQIIEEDTMFLSNPIFNNMPGDVGSKFESTRAYTFNTQTQKLDWVDVPQSSSDQNSLETKIFASVAVDGISTVNKIFTATGHQKDHWQRLLINKPQMFVNGWPPNYGQFINYRYGKKKNSQKRLNPLEEMAQERNREIEQVVVKRFINANDESVGFEWKTLQPGNSHSDPELIWEVTYQSSDLATNGSNSILIPLGKLLGNSDLIPNFEPSRTANFFLDYPRSYRFTIQLSVDDKYELGETEHLDKSIQNSTGFFTSNAELNDDGLQITCEFGWYNIFELSTKASQLSEIQSAFKDFSEQKILYRMLD